MSVSEAQKRATLKWQKEKTDEVRFRVPKGERARIQAHAEQQGESATAFIKRAIRETMERDNAAKWINLYIQLSVYIAHICQINEYTSNDFVT